MIEITYRTRGQRPKQTADIRTDANAASTLPPSFAVTGVRYSGPNITLLVSPPNDSISPEAVDAIATVFESRWGGMVEHVETTVVEEDG